MIQALTLDLDDTLWPIWPAIERAEAVLHAWLTEHAPATARRFDTAALRRLSDEVAQAHPERTHDLSWLRQHSIALALTQSGDDPAQAEPAFALFFEHRQRVDLFPGVTQALQRLAARWPLLALTNGNADLGRIGLAAHFVGGLSARDFGRGKPDPAFFHAACAQLGCAPAQVLHVGDDWALDIEGAWAAGQPSAWVRWQAQQQAPAGARAQPWAVVDSLADLADRLLGPAAPGEEMSR